tara:strand:+ start:35382 stop:35933 length:552 start_codon:yes stop_codon:yes gene_type:complete
MNSLEQQIFSKAEALIPDKISEKSFRADQKIFHQDDVFMDVLRIKKGFTKASFLTSEGKEVTKWFAAEGQIVASTLSLTLQAPAGFTLTAMEDTEFTYIRGFDLNALLEQDHRFAILVAKYAFSIAAKKEKRELDFLTKTPQERLVEFQRESSQLVGRLTQNELSKYLGITPVALSRIKARLR